MSGEGNIGDEAALLKILTPAGTKAGDVSLTFGQHTTVAEVDDDIPTKLGEVLSVAVSLVSDAISQASAFSGEPGTTPGTIKISGFNNAGNPATQFGRIVNWIAIGRSA